MKGTAPPCRRVEKERDREGDSPSSSGQNQRKQCDEEGTALLVAQKEKHTTRRGRTFTLCLMYPSVVLNELDTARRAVPSLYLRFTVRKRKNKEMTAGAPWTPTPRVVPRPGRLLRLVIINWEEWRVVSRSNIIFKKYTPFGDGHRR